MDKLTAYQVLGLDSDASLEEVKEAYARLSREFHPEENPEEFQQIHEAYATLTRAGRRRNDSVLSQPKVVKETTQQHQIMMDLAFYEIEGVQEDVDVPDFDFEESISQAESDEIKKLRIVIEQADRELKTLLMSSNYKKPDKFREFFQKEEYEKVFYTREFVRSFTQCLSQRKLLPELYSYVIEFYRLKRIEFEELDEDLQKLYQVIDRRYNVKKDTYLAQRSVNKYAMLAIATFVVSLNWNRVDILLEGIEFHPQYIVTCVIPYILIAGIGIWLYKVFRRQHSTYFAQAIVAVIYMGLSVVQMFIFQCLYDYTEALVSKLPLSLSVVFIWACVDWLIIIAITAFMQSFRKKK